MLRAMSYEKLGKFDLAIQDWTNLLKRKPDDPFYLWKRAELYRKIGQYDQAIEDYGKSIALNPREAVAAYYGRALVYALKGDSRKSIQDLRNAIQLDPATRPRS